MITHFEMPWGNPGSYSQAVTDGNLIFVCGQLGVEAGELPVPFEEQARTAISRLLTCVKEAGGDIDTIVKINGYLADIADFPVFDRIYRELVSVNPKPARTSVQIGGFAAPILVEVDAIALRKRS
jgi:2-iminobutanoate/2-iminopropanoate deaminase